MSVLTHLHQLIYKRHYKTVEIRPCHVLQMAAGYNACLKRHGHRGQIFLHSLLSGKTQLVENMIVTAGDQNTCLVDIQVLYQLKVLLRSTDPGGDLREVQAQIHALGDGIPVLFTVYKKLCLADYAVRSAQFAHKLVQVHNLLDCIGFDRLLPVPESCVGDPHFFGHSHRHAPVVEGYSRHLVIAEEVRIEIRVIYVLEGITVGFLLQQIGFVG